MLPHIYIIGNSSSTFDDLKQFFKDNETILKQYFIHNVDIITLKTNESIQNFDNFNLSSDIIDQKENIEIVI